MASLGDIEQEILNALTALDDLDGFDGLVGLDGQDGADALEVRAPDQDRPLDNLERTKTALASYLEELALMERDKVDAIAFMDRKAKSEIDFLKAEEERIRRRRQGLERRREAFRSHVREVMERFGLSRVEGRESVLHLRRVDRVALDCPARELPERFREVRIDYAPRKEAIRQTLKGGVEVPGARIEASNCLVVK